MAKKIDNSETRELIGFYQMGLDSIIQGNYSISCIDGKDPSWASEGYHPSTEYVIEIEKSEIVKYQQTIESFFGVTIFPFSNDKLYFGSGDKINVPTPSTDAIIPDNPKKDEDIKDNDTEETEGKSDDEEN